MSVEVPYNPTELQALNMAHFTGIVLTQEQVDWYVERRRVIFDDKKHKKTSVLVNLSDQELLDIELTPEQRCIFRPCFPGIFPTDK